MHIIILKEQTKSEDKIKPKDKKISSPKQGRTQQLKKAKSTTPPQKKTKKVSKK